MKKFLERWVDHYDDCINMAMPHVVVVGVLYYFGFSWLYWIIFLISLYKAVKK